MTQLFIAGVETVLPQEFSVTVKRENSFFTKSGEYTYDCTLRLDNPVNCQLYGFLNRTNKSDQLDTDRTAVLIADGHVYCRGKEVITRWTEDTVTIQIVSGESELNYFIGQDKKIEDLDLGSISEYDSLAGYYETLNSLPIVNKTYGTSDYCLVPIWTDNGQLNQIRFGATIEDDHGAHHGSTYYEFMHPAPQPYLCALIRRILTALGYNNDNETHVNQLEDGLFRNAFITNTVMTGEYAKMLPGWTVKDFLEEVEKLTGIVFVTNNTNTSHPSCDILLKSTYYYESRQVPLNNVVDAYETEVEDDESRDPEFSTSNVSYDIPSHALSNVMRFPEGIMEDFVTVDCNDYTEVRSAAEGYEVTDKVLFHDTSENRYYFIFAKRTTAFTPTTFLQEADQFRDLKREGTSSTLELGITPAPIAFSGGAALTRGYEIICLSSSLDGGFSFDYNENDSSEEEGGSSAYDIIQKYKKDESSRCDLYCAFYDGYITQDGTSVAVSYTDAYHCTLAMGGTHVGSLRLKDLDESYYQGGYEIDTRHAVTFETFDPNVIDPRQVYVIRNRRYVVRDVEETITAEGRQKMWKVTCYPITISDEAIEKRWILTKGVWDDGAAWLDDGRWNDNPIS